MRTPTLLRALVALSLAASLTEAAVVEPGTPLGAWMAKTAVPGEVVFAGMPHTQSIETFGGNTAALHWPFSTTITFNMSTTTQNLANFANIETGSTPVTAITNTIATWNAVGAAITLANGSFVANTTPANTAPNLVTFDNNATNISVTGGAGGALAITNYQYNSSLVITDADIIFNPTQSFSTLAGTAGATANTPNLYDIQSVATHEFGHAVGLAHSGFNSATMFALNAQGAIVGRTLSSDDRAAILHTYTTVNEFATTGAILGTITKNGNAVYGAHVVARSYVTGVSVTSTISTSNGTYTLTNLPAGPYYVYAEPLDLPAADNHIITSYWTTGKDTVFRTTFAGGNATPTIVRVQPSTATGGVNIAVSATAPTLNPVLIGAPAAGNGGFFAFSQGIEKNPNSNTFVAIGGAGFSALPDSAYTLAGAGTTLGPNSTAQGSLGSGTFKTFPVALTTNAPPGPRDIQISNNGEIAMMSGAIDVLETTPPSARVVSYGVGCTGTNGVLSLSTTATPSLGNAAFGLLITGTVPSGTLYLVFTYYPDYIDLGSNAGCALLVDINRPALPLNTFAIPTTGAPIALGLPIPNQPSLAGVKFYAQAAAPDPAAILTFKVSNALQFTVR